MYKIMAVNKEQSQLINETIVALSKEGGKNHMTKFIALLKTKDIEVIQQFKTSFLYKHPNLDEYLPFVYQETVETVSDHDSPMSDSDLTAWIQANKDELDEILAE